MKNIAQYVRKTLKKEINPFFYFYNFPIYNFVFYEFSEFSAAKHVSYTFSCTHLFYLCYNDIKWYLTVDNSDIFYYLAFVKREMFVMLIVKC